MGASRPFERKRDFVEIRLREAVGAWSVAMRKAIWMMLLAVVSSSAAAAWVEVGGNAIATAYADPATIRKNGNRAKMWDLFDLKTARASREGRSYLSTKQQAEYDCKEEQWRMLYFSWHSGNMGIGETVFSYAEPNNWGPIPPDSWVELLWKFACGKR